MKQQVSQGEIFAEGRHDILTMALGTEDHPGRLKVLSPGVSVTYLGVKRTRFST